MNKTIAQLETNNTPEYILGSDVDGRANKMTVEMFAEVMWNNMYIHARAVIVPCRYCGSHNAISNPTCVRCGAPMKQCDKEAE